MDESISDSILNCLSTILILSCRFGQHSEPKEATLRTICKAALPQGYFSRYIGNQNPASLNNNMSLLQDDVKGKIYFFKFIFFKEFKDAIPSGGVPSHVVAMGTICPTPSLPSSMHNSSVMVCYKYIFNLK